MPYSKLNIDSTVIKQLVNDFTNENYEDANVNSSLKRGGKEIQYCITITKEGLKKEIKISFISNKNGSTTINYKMGTSPNLSKDIADYVYNNGINDYRHNSIHSLNAVRNEDLSFTLEHLSDEYSTLKTETKQIANGTQIKIKIDTGEKITLNHYDTGTLTITGRPITLYNSVISCFTQLNYFKSVDIFDSAVSYYKITTKFSVFEEELRNRIPIAFQHLPENIKALITSSIILEKIDINMPDYSAYPFNILKAIEGIMKHILHNKGIQIDIFFDIFRETKPKVIMNNKTKKIINCSKTVEFIENLYEYHIKVRHVYFHTQYLDISTRLIETRKEALDIINNSLNIINDSYQKLLN